MKRAQFYFPQDLYKSLEFEAKAQKRSVADLAREMIEVELARRKKQQRGNIFAEFAKIAGTGPADLSTNYKKYLWGTASKWNRR